MTRAVPPIADDLDLDEFRRSLRRFVERELLPFERRQMSDEERRAIQDKARAAGFWLLDVPEPLGGQGLGLSGMAVFWHEISRTTAVSLVSCGAVMVTGDSCSVSGKNAKLPRVANDCVGSAGAMTRF